MTSMTSRAAPLAACLNALVADGFVLYLKTKSCHWHMFGPHFREYHALLDEQADAVFAVIDVLAERVRKLGCPTIRCFGDVERLRSIRDDDVSALAAEAMLASLLTDTQYYAAALRKAHASAAAIDDVATTSVLEPFIDEAERRAWFLAETLRIAAPAAN